MNLRNLLFILSIWITSGLHATIEVYSRFEPARIAVGGTSKYIVEIVESDTINLPSTKPIQSLPVPEIDGLSLRNGRISSNQKTSITNGRAEYSITQQLIVDAVPANVDSYTIPGYVFEYKGKPLQVPAATLTVTERSANSLPTTDELIR